MRAIRIEAIGRIAAADVPEPVPKAGEVLIELKGAARDADEVLL